MSNRFHPHLWSRLAEPLAITPEKLGEFSAAISAGVEAGSAKTAPLPSMYLAGNVAVIPVSGHLVRSSGGGAAGSAVTSYETIANGFRQALEDERATSILLHINSSGGEVAGVFALADQLHAARGRKPFIALVDELAASAAFLLAASADRVILASSLATVGSVGIISQHIDQSGALEKAGVKVTTLYIGDCKNDGNPNEPLSDEARARIMERLQVMFVEFVHRIAAFRGLSDQAVLATKASIYLGESALAVGFADAIQAPSELLAELNSNPETITMKILSTPGAAMPPGGNDHVAIATACATAGFPELTATLLQSGASMTNVEQVLADAAAISYACDVFRLPEMKASLVQSAATGVPLQTLRDLVTNIAAAQDAAIVTDTTRPSFSGLGAGTYDNPTFHAEALADALLSRFNPGADVPQHARQFVGMSVPDMAREVLRRNSRPTTGMGAASVIQAALQTTTDFPLLLSGFAEKTMRRAYQIAPSGLKMIAREATARDFKSVYRLAAGEFPALEKVNEHGEFRHGSFGEEGETYRLATYGKVIGLSRQSMINDDLSTFSDMSRRIALAASEFEAMQLAMLINANPIMADGKAVFHADHGNIASAGGAITSDTLSVGRRAMREQRGVDGLVYINTAPKFIVVNPARETEAERAVASITAASTGDANPFTGLTPVVDPRLTSGEHGGAWYMAGDPAIIDGIEYAYLDGNRGPRVETQNGFDYDGTRIKVALDFGCGWVDCRGWFKNPGN